MLWERKMSLESTGDSREMPPQSYLHVLPPYSERPEGHHSSGTLKSQAGPTHSSSQKSGPRNLAPLAMQINAENIDSKLFEIIIFFLANPF